MDENYKGILILCLVVVVLFAGGLYYIFTENQNHKITLNLTQQYIESDSKVERDSLELEIRQRIQKRPLALTSKASFESFDILILNAQGCDKVVRQEQAYDPENQTRSYEEIWRDCMDHPEQLSNQNSPR